jgi:hypothetical protein
VPQLPASHSNSSQRVNRSSSLTHSLNNSLHSTNSQAGGHLTPTSYSSHCRLKTESEPESESYVTTDGQSASLSWNKALIWGLRPNFCYCETVAGALSDERTGLSFTIAAVLASAVILGSESRWTRDHCLLSQIRDFPFCRLLRLTGLRWKYST